jgi:hypothetical protein
MSLRKTPLKLELTRRLRAARVPESRNQMTIGLLRRCARGYLEYWDGEVERDPSLSRRPHGYLWLLYGVPEEDAFFTVLMFWPRPRGMEFFCGTGDNETLRAFEHYGTTKHYGATKDPVGLFETMRQRFTMRNGRLRVNRAAAEEWLGRGW